MAGEFKKDLAPYELDDAVFFDYAHKGRGVGFVLPDFKNHSVKIPRKINLEYENYLKLCKAFAKLNLKKYKLTTEPNPEKQSFFIILNKETKIDWKELPDFVKVVTADKGISSRLSHKIMANILMFMDYFNDFAKRFKNDVITSFNVTEEVNKLLDEAYKAENELHANLSKIALIFQNYTSVDLHGDWLSSDKAVISWDDDDYNHYVIPVEYFLKAIKNLRPDRDKLTEDDLRRLSI